MRLYYFKDPHGNFGDDLNPWLWNQLWPEMQHGAQDEWFVGIGTLINHRLPLEPIKHVFGSGFGYGRQPPIDDRWVFHAVRGYETARALRLPRDTVITDAAVLIRTVYRPPTTSTRRGLGFGFGFMPHCLSSRMYDWASVCAELGFRYIDARWDVNRVLHEMVQCEVVMCEAMHGAIVADSLRIPWIPISCYEYISAFKWRDWLSTLELPYAPHRITSLYDAQRGLDSQTQFKNVIKRLLHTTGLWSERWARPPPTSTDEAARVRALQELRAASGGPVYLSRDALLASHTDRYLDTLDAVRRLHDTARGQSSGPPATLQQCRESSSVGERCIGFDQRRHAMLQRGPVS
jgi:succinoglycan biosynthesis protein ExoV